jgi:hypothetical protein
VRASCDDLELAFKGRCREIIFEVIAKERAPLFLRGSKVGYAGGRRLICWSTTAAGKLGTDAPLSGPS